MSILESTVPGGGWGQSLLAGPTASAPQLPRGQVDEVTLRAWRKHLRTDLFGAVGLYGAAHAIVGTQPLGSVATEVTPALVVGLLCFLAGLVLLGRALRTLDRPITAQCFAAATTAGRCLAVIMSLALTPCVWLVLVCS